MGLLRGRRDEGNTRGFWMREKLLTMAKIQERKLSIRDTAAAAPRAAAS